MSVVVAKCPQEEIDRAWPIASTYLAKAVAYSRGRYELDDVYWLLCSGRMQLWLAADGSKIVSACVTQICDYPSKTMLDISFLGGTGFSVFASLLLDKLKLFAKHMQCEGIEITGRPGWLRVLNKYGFKNKELVAMEVYI